MSFTSEKVKVESLEDFLKAQPNEVAKLLDDYYAWLATTGSKRFQAAKFDATNPTLDGFIKASRLNPKAFFPLVERMMPGDTSQYERLPLEKVTPYLKDSPVFVRNFRDVTGQEVTARSVLRTFVDEPDWGLDHNLWSYTEYGYGEQPYGEPEGESSKAPFHMKFQHENFIVNKFASHVLEGMTLDRMELFTRLAKLAFSTGHAYWGYRFTAWGMHYIQDLTQPYHSKAVPGKGGFYYFRYALSFRKAKIQEKTTQVEANRHFLYEDFVSYNLQKSYLEKDAETEALAKALVGGDASFGGKAITTKLLQDEITLFAAEHARTIDKTIAKAFGKEKTKDPKYNLEKDPNYKVAEVLAAVPPDNAKTMREETAKDFEMTSIATRAMLVMTHGK